MQSIYRKYYRPEPTVQIQISYNKKDNSNKKEVSNLSLHYLPLIQQFLDTLTDSKIYLFKT